MSNNPIELIRQGESLEFTFDLADDESNDGWTCLIEVKQYPDETALISRTIAVVDDQWSGFLTATETGALVPGTYTIFADITNSTTDQGRKDAQRFHVGKTW